MKNIILAKNAGFCFGVQRAVEESLKTQKKFNTKIYTLGPLIHNNDVVKYLEAHNIYSIELDQLNNLNPGDVIVVRSHGVSKKTIEILENKELIILDATCPFVTNIHKKVNKYSKEGYQIIILGDKNHPEVKGIEGWCIDGAIITKTGEISSSLKDKVCVVSQTTEKKENWDKTINNLSNHPKELLKFNTICAATEVRQKSVHEISKEVDLMIIVGGKNSSNTTKLYEIAKEKCENTIHIENAQELLNYKIDPEIKNIGVTAGASTPDWIIQEVINVVKGE